MLTSVSSLALDAAELRHFVDYLDRHIELDGSEHAPMAFRLLETTCGDRAASWADVISGASVALDARRQLWDTVAADLVACNGDSAFVGLS